MAAATHVGYFRGSLWNCDSRNQFMQPFDEFANNFLRRFDGFKLASESRPVRSAGRFPKSPNTAFEGCESSFLNFSLRLCELTAELTGTDGVGVWAKTRRQQQSPDDRQRPEIETTTNEPCRTESVYMSLNWKSKSETSREVRRLVSFRGTFVTKPRR